MINVMPIVPGINNTANEIGSKQQANSMANLLGFVNLVKGNINTPNFFSVLQGLQIDKSNNNVNFEEKNELDDLSEATMQVMPMLNQGLLFEATMQGVSVDTDNISAKNTYLLNKNIEPLKNITVDTADVLDTRKQEANLLMTNENAKVNNLIVTKPMLGVQVNKLTSESNNERPIQLAEINKDVSQNKSNINDKKANLGAIFQEGTKSNLSETTLATQFKPVTNNLNLTKNEVEFNVIADKMVNTGQVSMSELDNFDKKPVETQQIINQIVQKINLNSLKNQNQMVIKLKPEHLGELTLKVSVEQGIVSATFHATNQEVRGLLEAALPQLKQELQLQGLKVDYVGLSTGLEQFLAGQQHDKNSEYQEQLAKNLKRKDFKDDEEIPEQVQIQSTSDNGVDYKI